MRKKVLKDTLKIMYPSIIMETLDKILSVYLIIFIGSTIGSFANSVMRGNVSVARRDIIFLVLALILSVLGMPLYNIFSKSTMFKLSLKHDREIISNFIEKDYSKAMNYDVGEISYCLEIDPIDLRWGINEIIRNSIAVIFVSTGLIISLINISVLYGTVCLVCTALPLWVAFFVGTLDAKYRPKIKQYEETNRKLETDLCFNFVFIKMYKLKKTVIGSFSKLFGDYYEETIKKSVTYKYAEVFFNNLFSSFSVIIVLLFGAWLVSKGKIEAGAIATMLVYLDIVKTQYSDISKVIKRAAVLPQCLDRVGALYGNKEEVRSGEVSKFKDFKIDSMSYSYDGNTSTFDNVSFDIKEGEKLAVVGHNGSGKSTIIKILTGLYSNYGGHLKINNTDLKDLNLSQWRSQIAYIEQDPFIFKGSVYENVKLGNLNASEEELKAILNSTGLSELLEKEAEQFGENFSGGERQRISIARALLKKSNILFVDEPFNNLDTLGKKLIEELFSEKDKTIVFISHDDQLLKYADKVYTLTNTFY
jgi:ABC-type bacteriocin/lantibiotic exporter with double-glycine peptidase domain